jgi:uncharacterized cupin superfamily protein
VADVTAKKISEIDASMSGGFKHVGKDLGLSAFGINVIDMPAGYDGYPDHDHSEDGQEELYIPLSGRAVMETGGERHVLEPGMVIRVGPGEKRKLITEDERVRVLAIGGTPGKAYPSS